MPTAFNGDSFRNCALECSTDGVTWSDLAGQANQVTMSGGERAVGDAYAFNKETPSVAVGKRASVRLNVRVLYTETATEAYKVLKAIYENGTRFYFRYAPLGGQTGEDWLTCDPDAVPVSLVYPGGEAAPGDPIQCEYVIATESLTTSQKTS